MSLPGWAVVDFFEYSDFLAAARERLSPMVFDYVASGSASEATLRENERAWDRWVFRKRVLVDVEEVSTATTVLGRRVDLPVLVAPTAFQAMACPEGEVATAHAAAAAGTIMVVSTLGTRPLEEVAAAGQPGWFQLYIHKSRDLTEELADRAKAAGYGAIVLTVDTPKFAIRYADRRNGFRLPDGLEMANLRGRVLPTVAGESGLAAYAEAEMDASLTWDDVAWLRERCGLPLVLKGITTAEDARRGADAGAAAIVVSNHGGRQLDGDPATADVLPEVVDAVGDGVEVLVDGGIRHGAQVLKALALGARAVLVGRPVWWALAAGGESGVRRLFELLEDGLVDAMRCAGVRDVTDVPRDLVAAAPA